MHPKVNFTLIISRYFCNSWNKTQFSIFVCSVLLRALFKSPTHLKSLLDPIVGSLASYLTPPIRLSISIRTSRLTRTTNNVDEVHPWNGVKLNWPPKFAQYGPKFAQNMGDKKVFLNILWNNKIKKIICMNILNILKYF